MKPLAHQKSYEVTQPFSSRQLPLMIVVLKALLARSTAQLLVFAQKYQSDLTMLLPGHLSGK